MGAAASGRDTGMQEEIRAVCGRDPGQSTQHAPTSCRWTPVLSDTTCYSHCSFHYYSGPRRGGEGEIQSHWLELFPENRKLLSFL